MDNSFDVLVSMVLERLIQGEISDALTYEFINECSEKIRYSFSKWTDKLEKLWSYLQCSHFKSNHRGNFEYFFNYGRVYAAVEMLYLNQKKQIVLADTEQCFHRWIPVLMVLDSRRSVSYEKIVSMCNLKEEELNMILDELVDDLYIQRIKFGYKMYRYRLTEQGKKIKESVSICSD